MSDPNSGGSTAASGADARSAPKSGSSETTQTTQREGPKKMAPELDRKEQWDESASHPGYQKGDQGGYRGSYDETKSQDTEKRNFTAADGDHPSHGSGTPTKTPVEQTDPSLSKPREAQGKA